MRFTTPDYYDEFHCIAGECRDSCCIGWEIEIDSETMRFYECIPDEFGAWLHNNIKDRRFILDQQEHCPFLNAAGLCDIYTTLGKEHLCQICTDHPRFFSWFGDYKEGGVGLCCEAAATFIVTRPLHLITRSIPDDPGETCDPRLMEFLLEARAQMLSHLSNAEDLSLKVASLLHFAERLQDNLDDGVWKIPAWETVPSGRFDAAGMLDFLQTLEPMDKNWQAQLANVKGSLGKLPPPEAGDAHMLCNIGSYFLFRYFLQGVFDGEILSRVKLSVAAMQVIGLLWRYHRLMNENNDLMELCDIAKAFSKEMEYSEENLDRLLDAAYLLKAFAAESLSGFLQ